MPALILILLLLLSLSRLLVELYGIHGSVDGPSAVRSALLLRLLVLEGLAARRLQIPARPLSPGPASIFLHIQQHCIVSCGSNATRGWWIVCGHVLYVCFVVVRSGREDCIANG